MGKGLRIHTKERDGEITTAGRRGLGSKQFALPGRDPGRPGVKGRYPIDTIERARNALARVSQYGSADEKARVRCAVARKYPQIGRGGK